MCKVLALWLPLSLSIALVTWALPDTGCVSLPTNSLGSIKISFEVIQTETCHWSDIALSGWTLKLLDEDEQVTSLKIILWAAEPETKGYNSDYQDVELTIKAYSLAQLSVDETSPFAFVPIHVKVTGAKHLYYNKECENRCLALECEHYRIEEWTSNSTRISDKEILFYITSGTPAGFIVYLWADDREWNVCSYTKSWIKVDINLVQDKATCNGKWLGFQSPVQLLLRGR